MSNHITIESPANDGMETAIEDVEVHRRMMQNEPDLSLRFEMVCLAFTSENALSVYILLHWLLGCFSHITASTDDVKSFISLVYFMSTLIAFLSIMSHVSGLLIPLFMFCATGTFVLFSLINISLLNNPTSQKLYASICESSATRFYCDELEEHHIWTIFRSWLLIAFFLITCTTILAQCSRNEEYARNPQVLFYPNLMPREVPIGATNLDEPPRYSTLEPMPSPKSASSAVTSPPRYSYWERTFGKARNLSQCSEASVKSPTTARSQ